MKLAIISNVVSVGPREKKKERKGRNMMKLKDRSLAALMISLMPIVQQKTRHRKTVKKYFKKNNNRRLKNIKK